MVYIFTSESFPYGYAATNRIISYARGFIFHQKKVEVICFRKTEDRRNILNRQVKGIYRGIPYQYIYSSTVKSDFFIKRRLDILMNYARLFIISLSILNKHTYSIYYSSCTTPALILRITSWLKSSKIFKEESEHPSIYLMSKRFISSLIFRKVHYYLFDGLLLMTNNLIDYFKNEFYYSKPILHTPMTVDVERFQSVNIKRKNDIVYCGLLDDKKDGTDILIEAFSVISKSFPNYTLSLIGSATSIEDIQRYHKMVSDLNITGKVTFLGKINSDDMLMHLMEASILALPRPYSMQANYGFPTKLGEYLITGNPVVVTSVGEIPNYLNNGVNAYIAEPGSVESLIEKFKEVLDNKSVSDRIGENGKKTALKYFNNINLTKEILSFFKSI